MGEKSGEIWAKETGIPLPECKKQGCCCRGASPSTPYHQLLEKAANGDDFARNFFSIFVPHASHDDARKIVPGLVERTLRAAEKDEGFQSAEDVVFYQCRYIGDDNTCQIWEDRPQLCRAYPDGPFVVFAPNCAYEPWAKAVKEKFAAMKAEIEQLKSLQADLAQQAAHPESLLEPSLESAGGTAYTKIDAVIHGDHNEHGSENSDETQRPLWVAFPSLPMVVMSPLTSLMPRHF